MNEQEQNGGTSNAAADAPAFDEEFDAALAAISAGDEAPANAAASTAEEAGNEGAADNRAPANAAATEAPSAASAPAGDAPEPQDIWSNAPPELRAAADQLRRDYELRLETEKGRRAGLDRELARLRQQNPQPQPAAQPEGQHRGNDGNNGQQPQQQQQPATSDIVEKLREEYPELAAPILDLIEKQQATVEELKAITAPVQQEREKAEEARQLALLESQVSDWADAVRDDRFIGWLGQQPQSLQTAFNRNADKWVDGADAALVIGKFKQDVGFGTKAPLPVPPAQDERRQRQLANGRDAGSNSPSVSSSGPSDDDFEGWVDRFAKKGDQRASQRF